MPCVLVVVITVRLLVRALDASACGSSTQSHPYYVDRVRILHMSSVYVVSTAHPPWRLRLLLPPMTIMGTFTSA
jgi:hypothetical protein